jgi:hypothetical protein
VLGLPGIARRKKERGTSLSTLGTETRMINETNARVGRRDAHTIVWDFLML